MHTSLGQRRPACHVVALGLFAKVIDWVSAYTDANCAMERKVFTETMTLGKS